MNRNRPADLDEPLRRLDRLLEREILRLRARYELSLDEFRGLYMSDEQVDRLVRDTATGVDAAVLAPSTGRLLAPLSSNDTAWGTLAARLALEPLDLDLILLALAPEIDLKYETLYAYLNNDVARKWPTLDLAQRLLGDGPRTCAMIAMALSPAGKLSGLGILERIDPPSARPSRLNAGLALTPMVTQFLLGLPLADPRLAGIIETKPRHESDHASGDAEVCALVARLTALLRTRCDKAPAIALVGECGSGRRTTVVAICHELGVPMLSVQIGAVDHKSESISAVASALALHRSLRPSVLYLGGLHTVRGASEAMSAEGMRLIEMLLRQPAPIFIACDSHTDWRELLRSRRMLIVRLDESGYSQRLALWERQLGRAGIELSAADRRQLADRLLLSPGQIEDAIATARDLATLAHSATIDVPTLVAAARQQTDHKIGKLALKVESHHSWDDLVLPLTTRTRLKDLASAIHNRNVVYHEWGFARRVATGTGMQALFTGASGTGKTMAAGIIARELGFDLYKIELSGVISKYIGETEKNLERIFAAVRAANAMLFVDEAEAVLGKRSEVKDAHDRYANIEVAYLLQKLEEHDGVVILASNLKRNIDDAFARRMHYVIDFPLPDEAHRRKLWQGMFPRQMPLGSDVDFEFLARHFDLAGGDIKNVALDAAFLAAQDGQVVTMKQLVKAMGQQMMKQGRIPSPSDFKQYHGLIAQGE
jgi:ATPase family associated with various cellular activities (AAA)/Winged helix domain, variant